MYKLGGSREKTDADLLRELEMLLQPQVATAQRCKTLKELCESDRINRLADVSLIFFSYFSRSFAIGIAHLKCFLSL